MNKKYGWLTIVFCYHLSREHVLQNTVPLNFGVYTIPDKSLGTIIYSHFCNICQENLLLRPLPPNSMLFIVMKSSLLVY